MSNISTIKFFDVWVGFMDLLTILKYFLSSNVLPGVVSTCQNIIFLGLALPEIQSSKIIKHSVF